MKEHLYQKIKRLELETESMYGLVGDLSEEQLNDNVYGWSIIQVFSHLNMAESGSIMYMKKKMQAGDKMPNYTFGSKVKLIITRGLLQSSLRWKAPKVVSDPSGDYKLEEMKELWKKTRRLLEQFVDEYPVEYLNKAVYRHPFAGRLDLAAAIDSFTYHVRHHVHQIKRIRKKIEA